MPVEQQKLPHKLRAMLQLKGDREGGKKRRRHRHKQHGEQHTVDDPTNLFHRKRWETDHIFLSRVHRETEAYVQEHQMKIKYDLVGGDPLGLEDQEQRPRKGNKKPKQSKSIVASTSETIVEPSTTTTERESDSLSRSSKQQRVAKKLSVSLKQKHPTGKRKPVDLLAARELIAFGERVDAPPLLTARPRKVNSIPHAKPGKKDLLLKRFLPNVDGAQNNAGDREESEFRQRILDQERKRVIDLYRRMKKMDRTAPKKEQHSVI